MSSEPQLQEREAQRYVGIRKDVTLDSLGAAVDEAFPALFGWLGEHGIAPAGAPFIRYLVIDMMMSLQIELGVPVAAPAAGDGRVQPGTLPAGTYVVLRHTGPYDGLVGANAALQDWAEEHGVAFDTSDSPAGSVWGARVEHYLTNPAEVPDPQQWQTDVAYLTRR